MLSISKLKSSAQAVSYYEKDDYYVGNDGPSGQGEWFGRGAERLGLSGSVDREMFKDLLEGRLPNGQELGSHDEHGNRIHTPGWDLTFSAPKSASILIEAGDERLDAAHRAAAQTAMRWLEDKVVSYRQREFFDQRTINRSHNLVASVFHHHTSREQEPQRHTHYVVQNMTVREDGQWVSLHSKPFYEYLRAAGAIYRSELAIDVQKLGWTIERTGAELFEIAAVPEAVREANQTRRDQIEEAMQARGLENPKDADQAAMMTRKSKRCVDLDALRTQWNDKNKALGLDTEAVIETAREAGDRTPETPFRLDRAVDKALDRLSEAEAVFSHADLLRWSLAAGMGRARVTDISTEIERREKSGELQVALLPNGQTGWTTLRAKEQERRILDQLDRGKSDVKAIERSDRVEARLENSGLTPGQRAAVQLIATTEDRFVGVQGRAGAGKTTMLKTTRELLESRGYQLFGMAQISDAARKMQEASGIKSGTLQRHLASVRRDLHLIRDAGVWKADLIRAKYEKQVWIVDEASQVGLSELRSLSFAAGRLGARMVLIGDTQQLAAIGAGKPFGLMLDHGMASVNMTEILRQKDATERLALQKTYDRDIDGAMATLGDRISEIPSPEERLPAIVSAWSKLGTERDRSYVLTARNHEKRQLNDQMREVLRTEGKLAGEVEQPHLLRVFARQVDRADAGFYQIDDRVRFPRDRPSQGVKAGEYWAVSAIDKMTNTLTITRPSEQGMVSLKWDPETIKAKGGRASELFRPDSATLAPGESIRWTRNSRDVDTDQPGVHLTNGQKLTVRSVNEAQMEVETEAGQRLKIDTTREAGQHWDHAYATTVYSSQGGTKTTVLVNAEASAGELFNQKAFLVAISRQEQTITLYADDIARFQQNVKEKLGDKTSALEGKLAMADERREDLILQSLARMEAAFHSGDHEKEHEKERECEEQEKSRRGARRGLPEHAQAGDRDQNDLDFGNQEAQALRDLMQQRDKSKELEL